MRKFRYTTGTKVWLVILQQIFAVLLVVSIVLLSALFDRKMLNTNDIWDQSFINSGYYADVFHKTSQEIIKYVTLKEQFEKDGVYDEDKVIDVMSYASGRIGAAKQGGEGEKEEQGICYRLGDLLKWADNGHTEDERGIINEDYTPLSGKSLHQRLEDGTMDEAQVKRISQMTEQVLDNIGTDIGLYKRYLNKYDVNDSNVKYWISGTGDYEAGYWEETSNVAEMEKTADDTIVTYVIENENPSDIYTNMTDKEAQDEMKNALEDFGSYFYYDNVSLRMRTNVEGMEDYFYDQLEHMTGAVGENTVVLISVDTDFPYQDSFAAANREFQQYHPWIIGGIFLLAGSVISFIMTLVLITMAAGRVDGEETEVRLCWIDRIKTEFVFIALLLFVVVTTVTAMQIVYGDWKIPGMLIMAGTMTYVCDSVFLVLYLSLVRRVKAEMLWKSSFLYWLISGIAKIIKNIRVTARILVCFLGGSLIIFLLLYAVFVHHSMLALFGVTGIMVGASIYQLRNGIQKTRLLEGVNKIAEGNLKFKIDTEGFYEANKKMANAVNNIGDGLYYAVDENTKNERMKADLITNVSHDIKTPLTSIINYVNLIKMEHIEDEHLREYVGILDSKAQRLKQLTEDLVEASKISSGNIELHMQCIDFVELIYQTGGEFNEKFEAKDLTTITKLPKDPVYIMADGRRIWRVVENLYNNVAKYALAHTRVYVTVEVTDTEMEFSIKNISEQELKVDTTELTERFIRGDTARTTEGSGLGLSIAKNLTALMDGEFSISLDGDLFKASVRFPRIQNKQAQNATD